MGTQLRTPVTPGRLPWLALALVCSLAAGTLSPAHAQQLVPRVEGLSCARAIILARQADADIPRCSAIRNEPAFNTVIITSQRPERGSPWGSPRTIEIALATDEVAPASPAPQADPPPEAIPAVTIDPAESTASEPTADAASAPTIEDNAASASDPLVTTTEATDAASEPASEVATTVDTVAPASSAGSGSGSADVRDWLPTVGTGLVVAILVTGTAVVVKRVIDKPPPRPTSSPTLKVRAHAGQVPTTRLLFKAPRQVSLELQMRGICDPGTQQLRFNDQRKREA